MGYSGPEPASNWDQGPDTAAARHMTVVEERGETDPKTGKIHNPNGVKGRRRIDIIELYRTKGYLTEPQFKAARMLCLAWEKTRRSPPAIKEIQVDNSPKPDQHIDILIDRLGGYHRIARHIPKKYRAYIMHVVVDNRSISSMPGYRRVKYLERLQTGLDELARQLGI